MLTIIFFLVMLILIVSSVLVFCLVKKFSNKEAFYNDNQIKSIKKFYREKGAVDQSFYKKDIPFSRVCPKNTKCELLDRFYGGKHIIQFNEYLGIINHIYDSISEHRALDCYKFKELSTDELCGFNINEQAVQNFLNKKINEIKYNKIIYDRSCENFVVQEPKIVLNKCTKTGAILIYYYFTLFHPKRETSIDSVARILIDEDKMMEIVDVKSTVQFAGEYNGYQKHHVKGMSPFEPSLSIPVDVCIGNYKD